MNARSGDVTERLDPLTEAVEKFYEANPYPRPQRALDPSRDAWDKPRLRAEYHLHWPRQRYRDDFSILIAGCGTIQAAKFAMRWPNARVIGVDISQRSIEETNRLKLTHRLQNLELHRMAIERVGDLGCEFDLVVSTGVLHHLADPGAGLRALRHVVAPHGAIQLMVYATYGRAGVYMFQNYCRLLGIPPTPSAIRDLATTLASLPQDHPLVPLLRDAPDFRAYAGIADALLNPCDRSYTVGEFMALIAGADLRFGRWRRQAPYLPQCGAPASTPHAAALGGLSAAEQFAAMELFRGTMVRHSAILHPEGAPTEHQAVKFDQKDFLDDIPIRLPEALVVEKHSPDGPGAVLINPVHGYRDIALPLGRVEREILDAIDGKRSVHAIAGLIGSVNATCAVLKTLWMHDAIVFDASSSPHLTRPPPSTHCHSSEIRQP